MAFSLSPIGNEQQVDSNGAPLSGGLIYTYLAGSTTPAPTYTDNTGGTPQANPIVLNTLGRPASPIWLTDGVSYKFILTSSAGAQQWTIENITGVSSSTPTQDEWVLQSTVPTYISATQFSVPGDQTATFTVGRRVRAVCTWGVRYGYISVSAFTTLTTVTLVIDSGSLDSGLSAVSVGLLSSDNSSVPWVKTSASGLTVRGTLTVTGATTLAGNAASALQAVPKQQLDAAVLPAGAIQFFAMSTTPSGWLKANGAAVSRTTYATLFAAIGTVFGVGDGSTTFNLPDLRGEFVRGFDDGKGTDSGRAFGSSQAGQMPSHTHTQEISTSTTGGTNRGPGSTGAFLQYSGTTTAAGGTENSSENRPRNIALLACIKY